nr:hypothetical protein [uncultured Carboxylicivirga sp.]
MSLFELNCYKTVVVNFSIIHGSHNVAFMGGAMVSIWKGISFEGVVETIVYAAVGTLVSYGVSQCIKCVSKKIFKKHG